jgi:hypothetical protein
MVSAASHPLPGRLFQLKMKIVQFQFHLLSLQIFLEIGVERSIGPKESIENKHIKDSENK